MCDHSFYLKNDVLLSGCSKIWPNYQNFVESRRRPFEQSLFLFCFDLDPPKVSQNFCHVVHSTGNPSIVVVRDPFKPKEGSFLFTAAKHIFLFLFMFLILHSGRQRLSAFLIREKEEGGSNMREGASSGPKAKKTSF